MARTQRTDRKFQRRSARDGQGYCCPGGRGCSVCGSNLQYSRVKAQHLAERAVIEFWTDPEPEPEPQYPHVGSDAACTCFDCREVWSSLADPQWPF